jgi:hypothetical protein
MNDSASERDAAAKEFARELDEAEYSPAQPDDATRIDGTADTGVASPPPHVKHDDAGRMQH